LLSNMLGSKSAGKIFNKIASRSFSSSLDSIKTVGVIGAGQMGTGIAIVANNVTKKNVKIIDTSEDSLARSQKFLEKWADKEMAKGRMTIDDKYSFLDRFTCSVNLVDLSEVDFVVEAVNEEFQLKEKIFRALDQITRPDVVLASNTSSISITKLAAVTQRPGQVIGMHFMNPVPVMKLIEVIQGLQTTAETLDLTLELSKAMGKTTATSQDIPGFIINRILIPYINEAAYVLYEGIASVEDIDTAMQLGTNVPMGPLTLADFIGLDTCLNIMDVLHSEFKDSKYRPCPLLVNYVRAGYFGRKSGRGFYDYSKK